MPRHRNHPEHVGPFFRRALRQLVEYRACRQYPAGHGSATIEHMADYIGGAVGALVTLAITKGFPLLSRAYQRRCIDPKRAHQEVFLEQTAWFEERASKLAVFRFELTNGPAPDKFKLAQLVSKLDRKDREWAKKETDITLLGRYAAEKAAECHDNAGECARHADEINYRTFVFPLV